MIIMDVVQDFRGFPSTIGDDPILNLVLPEPESYAYAEERDDAFTRLVNAMNVWRYYLGQPPTDTANGRIAFTADAIREGDVEFFGYKPEDFR